MTPSLRAMTDDELAREFRRYSDIRDQAQARINEISAEDNRRLNARLAQICAAKAMGCIAAAELAKGRNNG